MSAQHRSLGALVLGLAGWAGLACHHKPPAETDPTQFAQHAVDQAADLVARNQLRQASSLLKRIEFAGDSRADLEPKMRLLLADATFYQGTDLGWIDSRNLYTQFITLNSDHELAPYAQLQVGMCSLKQVNQPSKDQAVTLQAIRDFEVVEQRWPGTPYAVAARAMLREARGRMAESEFLVGRFYLKRKSYDAAIERFYGVIVRFPDFSEYDKVLYHLAQAYLARGDVPLAKAQLDRLLTEYPNGAWVERAQKTLGSLPEKLDTEVGAASN